MKTPNFALIAKQLREYATALEDNGYEAWKRALAVTSPLRATSGTGRSGGPTIKVPNEQGEDETVPVTAVEAAVFHRDPLIDAFPRLRQAVELAYHNAVDAHALIVVLTKNMAENERAGVGRCDCGRYCDGTATNRLRSGRCPACDQRDRERRKQGAA